METHPNFSTRPHEKSRYNIEKDKTTVVWHKVSNFKIQNLKGNFPQPLSLPCSPYLPLAVFPLEQVEPEDSVVAEHDSVSRGGVELHLITSSKSDPRRAALEGTAAEATE